MAEEQLSLPAELLLLAIDPARGGLVPHDRRRLRRALVETHGANSRGRRSRWGARRHALRELERAGLVEPRLRLGGRVRLADRRRAAARFHRVHRGLQNDDLREPRDRELAILLAWTGVLAHRLSREERRIAVRRFRKLARSPALDGLWQAPLSGTLAEPEWVSAVGRVAYDIQSDLLAGALSDLVSGGEAASQSVGLSAAGNESFAGSDGAGSDCR